MHYELEITWKTLEKKIRLRFTWYPTNYVSRNINSLNGMKIRAFFVFVLLNAIKVQSYKRNENFGKVL